MHMKFIQGLIDVCDDALRWRKLIRLAGSTKDGSETTIKLYQDDATDTAFITVGGRRYYSESGSFEGALDEVEE